jgi:lysozyme
MTQQHKPHLTIRTRNLLRLHEGCKPSAYQDSLGYWTIGVGHLIDARKGGTISEKVINQLLDDDIGDASRALAAALPWVDGLDDVRWYVLLDMTFNMGIEPFDHDGTKDWPMFVEQVRTGKYVAAANNMRSTLWASQVKGRAIRLAAMMESGEWPNGF